VLFVKNDSFLRLFLKALKMKPYAIVLFVLMIMSCREQETKAFSAQRIVDKSIEVSGGDLYQTSDISFVFRDRTYELEYREDQKILKRITTTDTSSIVDVRRSEGLQRFINDSLVHIPDSLAIRYANSVNSVHYFAYLPYGLNDDAVTKRLLGEVKIKDNDYYKIEVTFDQKRGGDDFEDVYIYWFNKETFKPDFLAYEFHIDGGGMRFREAYNERYVNGIRFVDYNNYKPKEEIPIYETDRLFETAKLELLSKIELKDITVSQGSYN